MASSLIVVFFVGVLTQRWKDFQTALLATGLTLGCFVVWHLLRVPWLLHRSVHGKSETKEPGTAAGIFGLMMIVGVFAGGYELALAVWNSKPIGEITSVVPSADPGAKDAEIISLKAALSAAQQTASNGGVAWKPGMNIGFVGASGSTTIKNSRSYGANVGFDLGPSKKATVEGSVAVAPKNRTPKPPKEIPKN